MAPEGFGLAVFTKLRHAEREEMTLIELIIFILNLGFVVAVSILFGQAGGPVAAVGAAVVAIGFLAFFYWALFTVDAIFRRWHPRIPSCENGVCNAEDYKWVPGKGEFLVCRCKCGTTYIFKGRKFMLLSPDGSERPFMRKTLFGTWKPDEGAVEGQADVS
jgi:hypothetical protein